MWRSDLMSARLLHVVALGSVFLMAGCHTYRLVEDVPIGSTARFRVPVRSAIAGPNAPPETATIEGRVLTTGDTISFEASNRQVVGAFREIVRYDTLTVARDGLASIEVREFSTARSVVLGVGVAVGTAGLALAALGVRGGEAGDGPGGDGSEAFTTGSVTAGISIVVGVVGGIGRLFGR